MDATHFLERGTLLCGARSSTVTIDHACVTCAACRALLAARGAQRPGMARALERYAALCKEDETVTTGEFPALSLRASTRPRCAAALAWMRRVLARARG